MKTRAPAVHIIPCDQLTRPKQRSTSSHMSGQRKNYEKLPTVQMEQGRQLKFRTKDSAGQISRNGRKDLGRSHIGLRRRGLRGIVNELMARRQTSLNSLVSSENYIKDEEGDVTLD